MSSHDATILRRLRRHRPALLGILGVGLVLLLTPAGGPLERFSYDAFFLFRAERIRDIALVYADEGTLRSVPGDPAGALVRDAHARLIDRLHGDGARLIVYDFVFAHTNREPGADQALARAIRSASNVVLAGSYTWTRDNHGSKAAPVPPHSLFRAGARAWGVATFEHLDSDRAVRRFAGHMAQSTNATLAWAAADVLKPGHAREKWPEPAEPRWLNYYGPARSGVFRTYSLEQVLDPEGLPAGTFSNRVVVVGTQGILSRGSLSSEAFANPHTRFSFGRVEYPDSSGYEIHATALRNLLERDWFTRVPFWMELLLVLLWGACLSALYLQGRWRHATRLVLAAAAALITAAILLALATGYWFAWCVPFCAQTLVAWFALDWVNPLPMGPPLAFLSYRRESGSEHARLLRSALAERRIRAFLDVVDLGPGRYDAQLQGQIARIPNFILIVGPTSLARCRDAEDGVRAEIEGALRARALIIPVLVDGFDWKNAPELPTSLRDLPKLEAVSYSHQEFDATLERLCQFLRPRGRRKPG